MAFVKNLNFLPISFGYGSGITFLTRVGPWDRVSQLEDVVTLVPQNDNGLNRRSVEVTRAYLRRGRGVTRVMWINISPRNPVLKAIVAVPAAAVMLSMFILMMLVLSIVLLSVMVVWLLSGRTHREKAGCI